MITDLIGNVVFIMKLCNHLAACLTKKEPSQNMVAHPYCSIREKTKHQSCGIVFNTISLIMKSEMKVFSHHSWGSCNHIFKGPLPLKAPSDTMNSSYNSSGHTFGNKVDLWWMPLIILTQTHTQCNDQSASQKVICNCWLFISSNFFALSLDPNIAKYCTTWYFFMSGALA